MEYKLYYTTRVVPADQDSSFTDPHNETHNSTKFSKLRGNCSLSCWWKSAHQQILIKVSAAQWANFSRFGLLWALNAMRTWPNGWNYSRYHLTGVQADKIDFCHIQPSLATRINVKVWRIRYDLYYISYISYNLYHIAYLIEGSPSIRAQLSYDSLRSRLKSHPQSVIRKRDSST